MGIALDHFLSSPNSYAIMSVPYKIEASEELLLGNQSQQPRASQKIPIIARPFVSDRAKKTLDIVEKFVEEECIPADPLYAQQIGEGVATRFSAHPPILEDLKKRARELGLWNMFLPKNHFKEGAGFSNLEYGLMAEYLGKSHIASEATNCAAPDTGNMEVFAKYGTQAQKDRWLKPLLEGKSDPNNSNVYKQQSVMFVPADTPGITIKRMLSVYGFDDAPHGHGHIVFNNVRVPAENMCLGAGRGFEVIQGRLGPGRIHHAMRSIGAAEKALEYFLARINDPKKKPFGKQLYEHGVMLERVARSRIEIDTARLSVLNAALMIDSKDAKFALKEIAEAKVLVPQVALDVIDRAVQAYGGAGVSQDTPLANMWAHGRTMKIVDGPDEVHLIQLGRNENKRGGWLLEKIEWQKKKGDEMAKAYGITRRDVLQLDREHAKAKL